LEKLEQNKGSKEESSKFEEIEYRIIDLELKVDSIKCNLIIFDDF
jgi:hypothetical protein